MEGPCMEIDASSFVLVFGPSFTAALLQQAASLEENTTTNGSVSPSPASKLPALDSKSLIEEGIAVLLDSRQFQSDAERRECELVYRKALEVDPLVKLCSTLQQCGRYAEWLERCFSLDAGLLAKCRRSGLLEGLVGLIQRGALCVYTGCDDLLSKLTNLQILLAQRQDSVEQWGKGEAKGILYVHGVYWVPDSLQLGCEVYSHPQHPSRPAMEHLGAIFREKAVITLGVCESVRLNDPMATNFASNFLEHGNCHRFNLSMDARGPPDWREMGGKILHIQSSSSAHFPVKYMSEPSKITYKEIEFPSMDVSELRDHQLMALLVSSKQGASEIARLMFSSPGVNFALMSSVTTAGQVTYTVSLRVESAKLPELWVWLWEEKRALLSQLGLQAVVMQGGTIVWLHGNGSSTRGMLKQLKQEPVDPVTPMEMAPGPIPSGALTNHHNNTTIVTPNSKLLSPLVRQEFPIPKQGTKKVPRYTVTKFPAKPSAGTSFTLPPGTGNSLSKAHLHGFNDDTNMFAHLDLPKSVLARRCSLPPNIIAGGPDTSENTLYKLAESVSSEPHPPSYTAIKQALLCDKYKRRQSMQTDPKTLKNLLQTKLVISESKTDDLVNLRRKSDPGSYLKQRDFDRRKELFLDENLSWSKSYSHVIDQQIQRWKKKREQRLQRDFLHWQKAELGSALNPLKLGMINPLMAAQQGIINPLQIAGAGGLANPALFPGSFLNAAAAAGTPGGMVAPYILPQGIVGGVPGTTANSNIYYSPFGTQYALVSPYSSLQVGQTPQSAAAAAATYLVPQATLTSAQPSVYYYMPASAVPAAAASSTSSSSVSSAAATPLTLGTSHASSSPMSSNASSPGGPGVTLYQPSINTAQPISPTTLKPRPVSPTSRKRHQSVPEKLTSLLQPPAILCGRVSPMEMNPDSPPSSKKQRSTSDTTLYHTPYGLPQLSPGSQIHSPGGQSHSPHSSHSASPQPPSAASNSGVSFEGLSALQTHLLQVHSYGINRTAQEERQRRRNRSPREKGSSGRGHSPSRRKHSGGVKSGSVSPSSILSNEDEQTTSWPGKEAPLPGSRIVAPAEREENQVRDNNHMIKVENSAPEQHNNDNSQLTLWQFLLELLVASDADLLQWTDNEFEFQISKPTEVSQLWGQLTNNNSMSYEKLYAAFKYYFNQGILSQVQGRKLTFKFAGHIRNYVQMRRSQSSSPALEEMVVVE